MLIFGSDDNDDDLDLDGSNKTTPPTPPTSSLPTRPVKKSPFGANPDQVENLVPEKNPELPVPPQRPVSPFGQNPVQNTPQAPQNVPASNNPRPPLNPLSGARRTLPAIPESNETSSKPLPPFSKSEEPTPPAPTSYLPPVRESTPSDQSAAQQPESEQEHLSENELLLRAMQEQAAERSRAAKKEEAERLAAIPAATPVVVSQDAPSVPAEEDSKEKKKPGFFSPPPKKPSTAKKTATKIPKERKYDGERKKILYIRLVAGSVAAIIAFAGLQAIFVPKNGPTKEMVQSAAREAVNYTGFPTVSGEQFALDFTRAYFNFDTKDATRTTSLQRFASPDLVKQIDISTLSSTEYTALKKSNVSYNDYSVSQNISYGPYVVATNNITAENALFTVKLGLNSGEVLYFDVPVKYDSSNYSLTLAGPPSFSKPIQNQGATLTKDQWTTTFSGGNDDAIVGSFQKDLEAYLTAWAGSDSTIINRYSLPSATDNAKKGLQQAVTFVKIIDLKIEPEDKNNPSTATQRRIEVNVLWEDPKTNLRYPQQYRMLIAMNPEKKWAIYDIENFVVLNK